MHLPQESTFDEIELLAQKQSSLEKSLAGRNREEAPRRESGDNAPRFALALAVSLALGGIIALRRRNSSPS